MSLTVFFGTLGALLVLAFVANRLSSRTRVPDVIVLMVAGLLLGPTLHWIHAEQFESATRGFGALALILILFEAGLELELRETVRHFPGGVVLSILSYAISMVGVAYFAKAALGIALLPAFLVGAVVGCISSSVVLPVLQQISIRAPLRTTLVVEASLSDALGVLAVSVLLDLYPGARSGAGGWMSQWLLRVEPGGTGHGSILGGVLASFALKVLIAAGLAILSGILWSKLLPLLSEQRFWQVLTFGAVLLVYAGTQAAGGSDLFAVLVFGATLANFRRGEHEFALSELRMEQQSKELHRQILSFHSELAFLVRTFFFVLLGVIVDFRGLERIALLALGSLGVLYLARWIAVGLSRPAMRGMLARERELMVWMIPRGLITAVLALEVVERRGVDFPFLTALAFALILTTNLILLVGSLRARGTPLAEAPESKPTPAA